MVSPWLAKARATISEGFSMQAGKVLGAAAVMAAALAAGGCSSIRENRGYIQDPVLVAAVQPGIDNRQSVAATLGRERGFLEDLFGNIGRVGAGGMGSPAGGPG